jgi:hypothetical protein
MNSCIIYKIRNNYCIVPQSETKAGFLLSVLPLRIVSIEKAELEFSNVLCDLFLQEKNVIETPNREELRSLSEIVLKEIGVKSYSDLYKNYKSCEIRADEKTMNIYRYRLFNFSRPSSGLVWDEDNKIKIENYKHNKDLVYNSFIELMK